MPDFGAVLILGHMVVSIFQVPLGQPFYQFIPYPNMEVCQEHVQYHSTGNQGFQMSMEYKMLKSAQCIDRATFEAEMARQRAAQQPQQPQQIIPAPTEEDMQKTPEGWEVK